MEEEKKLMFGVTLKHMNTFDMALLKLAIISFVLFVVSLWSEFANWVMNTNWVWFLVAWIVFMIRPVIRAWKK